MSISIKNKDYSDDKYKSSNAGLNTQPKSVTWRSVTLGLLLMPINAYWIIQMERVRYSAHPTTISLLFNCISFLVVLTLINALVRRVKAKWALNQGELLLIYSMLCIGSCMAAHDFAQVLVPTLTFPFSQDNVSNGFKDMFWHYLPKWAMMPDVKAADSFWQGHSTLYTRQHMLAWLQPTLVWTGFITVLLFTMQCINVLIRKQWTDNEKLTYPIAKIPIEITESLSGTSTNKPIHKSVLFWLGFVLAGGIDILNSINYYMPSVPAIGPGNGASYWDLGPMFTTKPWNAIGWTPLSFYPFVIGLGMLMPMDFLFSSWFFYIFWKLQVVLSTAYAFDSDNRMPYSNYQAFGAYIMFFASTLWISRHYFAKVVRCALGMQTDITDKDEPLSYRGAFLGLAIGLAILIGISMAMGLDWWVAILFFLIYLALALAITRMRAELGTPVHDLHFTGPDWVLADLVGSRSLGPQNLGVFSMFFWFNRAYRAHPMPTQLESFKLAEHAGAKKEMSKWFWVLLLAGAVGMICAFWAMLVCYYHYGGNVKITYSFGGESWWRYKDWIQHPKAENSRCGIAIIVGFLFAAFLQMMRVRYAWWPFHPLAYAVSGSWEMNLLWFPLFCAWVFKSLLLRYGGVNTYRKALPFFYGLILGQFIPGAIMNIIGIITETPTYNFWQ